MTEDVTAEMVKLKRLKIQTAARLLEVRWKLFSEDIVFTSLESNLIDPLCDYLKKVYQEEEPVK